MKAVFTRAVERGDGLDVRPHEVVADEGTGHVVALAGGLGDEADARVGNLVGIHFLLGVYALAVGNTSVVERAEAVHVDGAPRVHERSHHHAEGFDGGFRVGIAHGGHHGNLLAKLVHFYGWTYCHCLRVHLPDKALSARNFRQKRLNSIIFSFVGTRSKA